MYLPQEKPIMLVQICTCGTSCGNCNKNVQVICSAQAPRLATIVESKKKIKSRYNFQVMAFVKFIYVFLYGACTFANLHPVYTSLQICK